MRDAYYLPWVGPDGTPTERDEQCMRNLWYAARDVALHTRCTHQEVLEQLYRQIGHDYNAMHGGVR